MPIRGSAVSRDDSFNNDVAGLEKTYPKIEQTVAELEDGLKLDHELPHVALPDLPDTFAVFVDYPPNGASGIQQFEVIYHATTPSPSWNEPYRHFTLLTIEDRRPPPK